MMKRIGTLFLLIGVFIVGISLAQRSGGGSMRVRGNTRHEGASLPPTPQSQPDGKNFNNPGLRGNLNPHTGKEGKRLTPPLWWWALPWSWVTQSGEVQPPGSSSSPAGNSYWYDRKEEIWPAAGKANDFLPANPNRDLRQRPVSPEKPPSPTIINLPPFAASPDATLLANPQEEARDQTVNISPPDEFYHRAGCRLMGRIREVIKLKEAVKQGYIPCKVCKP